MTAFWPLHFGKAMLGITANWGLSDGSLGGNPPAVAERWLDGLRLATIRAGFRRDGRYRPVEHVTLVFAGDTLDLLLTERWTGRERPWHAGRRGRMARLDVLTATLRAARGPIARLRSWARHGLGVPTADARGRPTDRIVTRVEVEPVLLLGDRDADLGQVSTAVDRFGLRIGEAWSDGSHEIRHGHDLDPLRFRADVGDRLSAEAFRPTLAESLTVGLLVPFAVGMRDIPVAWQSLKPMLGRLAAAAPVEMTEQIATLLARLAPVQREAVADHWRRSVGRWFSAALSDPPAHELEFDAPAALAAWLESAAGLAWSANCVPPEIRRLEVAAPRGRVGGTMVLGHLATHAVTGNGAVVGLGGEFPRLLIRPWPSAALDLSWFGPHPQDSGIVRVGDAVAGERFVDAA